MSGGWVLQDQRDALARADADAEHAVAGPALPQLGRQREQVTGAGGAERVTDGDGASVRVEALIQDLEAVELVRELAQNRQCHRGVGLVDLPDVDLMRLQTGAL